MTENEGGSTINAQIFNRNIRNNEYIDDRYEHIENIGRGNFSSLGMGVTVSKVRIKPNATLGSAKKNMGVKTKIKVFKTSLFGKKDNKEKNDEKFYRANTTYYAMKTIDSDNPKAKKLHKKFNDGDDSSNNGEESTNWWDDEISILNELDHPNIVRIHEVYYTNSLLYIIMDYNGGGNLYDRFPYESEKDVVVIIDQLLSALIYMHDRGIVHRDLKFDNIMYASATGTTIRLIGFDMAKKITDKDTNTPSAPIVGKPNTVSYAMAPELVQGTGFSTKCDMWSVGVIIYMMITGLRPFHSNKVKEMIEDICNVKYDVETLNKSKSISQNAKDIIQSLIVFDPEKRLSAKQALNEHNWLKKDNRKNVPDEKLFQEKFGGILMDYKQTSALKKVALNVIAHRSTTDEIVGLRKIFEMYDKDNSGVINLDELKAGLSKSSLSEEAITEIFESIDINGTGNILYTEFLAATLAVKGQMEEERIAEAFDKLDSDNTGYISRENLRQILGSNCDEKVISQMIEEIDSNNDGKISYKEFKEAFRSQTTKLANKMTSNE